MTNWNVSLKLSDLKAPRDKPERFLYGRTPSPTVKKVTGPKENSEFCFPRTPSPPIRKRIWVGRYNKYTYWAVEQASLQGCHSGQTAIISFIFQHDVGKLRFKSGGPCFKSANPISRECRHSLTPCCNGLSSPTFNSLFLILKYPAGKYLTSWQPRHTSVLLVIFVLISSVLH